MDFLKKIRQPNDDIESVLKKIFYDEALLNYNFNGRCNIPNLKKRAMKDYTIFVGCLQGTRLKLYMFWLLSKFIFVLLQKHGIGMELHRNKLLRR